MVVVVSYTLRQYDYLMHAILGYAASELMSRHKEDQSLLSAALEHRIKAIRAIKKALAGAEKNKSSTATCNDASTLWEEGNALMATCFVLTYRTWSLVIQFAVYTDDLTFLSDRICPAA